MYYKTILSRMRSLLACDGSALMRFFLARICVDHADLLLAFPE